MFFNVSREKSGRPGRSGDVMDAVWATISLSPSTRPRNVLHAEKLASTVMAQRYNVQARVFKSRELPTKQQWRELEIDVALGGESLDSQL